MQKKLLVVDDSIFIWEELKRILVDTEFEITGFAKSGEQALEMYADLKPDLVTMDIILPGLDGIETAKMIISKWPDAKVVVVSSLAYDETMAQADSVGACGFIFKPFEPEYLLKTLRKAFAD